MVNASVALSHELKARESFDPRLCGYVCFQRTLYNVASASFHEGRFWEEGDDLLHPLHHLSVTLECLAVGAGAKGMKVGA